MAEEEVKQEIPLSEDEKVFQEMNAQLGNIELKREDLAKILLEAAKTTKLNPQEDSPRITEVKLALFNAADSILKSQESLQINKAKMSLAKKQEATSDNVKQMAIEILKNIDLSRKSNAPVVLDASSDAALKTAFEESLKQDPSLTIKDDELVTDDH